MARIIHPDAIWEGENYLVCSHTLGGDEWIHQSERSEERAERSTDVLNEHERNNARREAYFWRKRIKGEIPNGQRQYA